MTNLQRIKLIWKFAKPYLLLFLIAEICILGMYAISIVLPLNLTALTDKVIYLRQYQLLPHVILNYIILFAISVLLNTIYAFIWQKLNNCYVLRIKNALYKKVLYAKARYLNGMNSGDIMSRIDTDAEQFIHAIQKNVFHFLNSVFLCVAIVVMIGKINLAIAAMLFGAALLPVILTRILGKRTGKYAKEMRENAGANTGLIFEFLKGMHEIRFLNARKWATEKVLAWVRTQNRLGNSIRKIDLIADKSIEFINLLTLTAIYAYSISLVYAGNLSIGFCLAILQYVALLHKKMNWALRIGLDWNNRKVSIDRVAEVLAYESEDPEPAEAVMKNDRFSSLEFRNVSFSYGSEAVLKNVSFTIRQGEKAALVGVSGAGKTTIMGLILKLYRPQSGEILLNGRNIEELDCHAVRSRVSVVQQEITLFDQSVRYNLTLGNNRYTEKEIKEACRRAGLNDVIGRLPAGLETNLGGNIKLSAGQKQRVMIARALLKKSDFFLFDEATSALDVQTERDIVQQFAFTPGITSIVISHRPSTLQNCNKTIVLRDGRVEDTDPLRQPLQNPGACVPISGGGLRL